jgi:hypothetical protein
MIIRRLGMRFAIWSETLLTHDIWLVRFNNGKGYDNIDAIYNVEAEAIKHRDAWNDHLEDWKQQGYKFPAARYYIEGRPVLSTFTLEPHRFDNF